MICPNCTTELRMDGTCPMCIAYERELRALRTLPKPEYGPSLSVAEREAVDQWMEESNQ